MVPLEILVAMESAWKKEVFSGPRPVLPGGTNTSMGAKAPAFAGAATWCGVHVHVCECVCMCTGGETRVSDCIVNWTCFKFLSNKYILF